MENELQERSAHDIESLPDCVHGASTCLESVLFTLFKNIDKDTQKLSSEAFTNLQDTEMKTDLQRIALLTRRIQREIS
jgi:hypothetical protein